ncbi:MAG: hypothetical protein ACR2MB_16785 [Acidimicrobiales bacterium]
MAYEAQLIIDLAETERTTVPLNASAGVLAVLDAHGSSFEAIEASWTSSSCP